MSERPPLRLVPPLSPEQKARAAVVELDEYRRKIRAGAIRREAAVSDRKLPERIVRALAARILLR